MERSAGHLHFTGIGGVGMAGLAYLFEKLGFDVSGCDRSRSARTDWLESEGIRVSIGHDASHAAGTDAIVVTPAVPPDEPEIVAARTGGIPVRSRGEMLAELSNASECIAVCGTHGKTTTAVFTAKLLESLGEDPSWCIGGECGAMPVARAGKGPLVIEADESDGTLALYRAHTLVVTCVEYDHPEHFKTVEDYRACFSAAEAAAGDVIRSEELDASGWPELERLVRGRHNVANARAAIEVAVRRGHSRKRIAAALPAALASLPDRRFQPVWPPPDGAAAEPSMRVYADYAHHPTELSCAVGMAASLYPGRLRVVFQPHRFSRTLALKDAFPPAFELAQEIVLVPVYPAFEKPVAGGGIGDLYASFREYQLARPGIWPQGLRLARGVAEAWRHLFLTRAPGDLVLLAGAGDIIGAVPRIVRDLSSASGGREMRPPLPLGGFSFFGTGGVSYGGGKKRIAGMGSNSWFSDCATDEEIARAYDPSALPGIDGRVPAEMPGAQLLRRFPALAFMAGIPGTAGGWTKMNAGAFGDSFGNHVESVEVEEEDGTVRTIPAAECGFAYRRSSIPGRILSVRLKAQAAIAGPSANAPEDCLAKRKRFPARTCGSVFRNPSQDEPAGMLLESSGAKGMRVGGAYVWPEHANVIVAGEGATSSDIFALALRMADAVREKRGVSLEPEICGLEAVAPLSRGEIWNDCRD